MSRAPAHTNFARVKLWTEGGASIETSGGSLGVMRIMFTALTATQRERLLATLQATNESLKNAEVQKGDQQPVEVGL